MLLQNGETGARKGEGGGDHLIAGLDARGKQCGVQRRRTAVECQRMFAAGECGPCLLQRRRLGAVILSGENIAVQNGHDGIFVRLCDVGPTPL